MTLIVDIDDRETWPHQVVDIVDKWAGQYKDTTEYTCDLDLALENEKEFRELLSGHLLRAYHCTRLLPHEVDMVKQSGLRTFTADLLYDRIKSVQDIGAISSEDAKELQDAHAFATGEQQNRENQVCLILSKNMFQHNLDGCTPLLKNWGGEGIYKFSKTPSILAHLQSLSKPTIVVTLLDLGGRSSSHLVFPSLHKVFVGSALHLSDVGADVFYKASVPPEHIEGILQPSESEYNLLGDLPR